MHRDERRRPSPASVAGSRSDSVLRPKPPYDFELTVHKPAGWSLFTPYEELAAPTLWTATYLLDELVGVKLTSTGTISRPSIAARIFLATPPTRARAKALEDGFRSMRGPSRCSRSCSTAGRRRAIETASRP